MWQDIIRKSPISRIAIDYIDELMADGEKRTLNEILDVMFTILESQRSYRTKSEEWHRKWDKYFIQGSSKLRIPTRGELKRYLEKNYSRGIFNNNTGEELPNKTQPTLRTESRKYWK